MTIELYTSATPNGYKVSIMLEELGVDYKVHKIDLGKQEQKEEWFSKIFTKLDIDFLIYLKNQIEIVR